MTEQSQLGPSMDGTVVLDIGGDIGALILLTGPDLLLAEIEISRLDGGPVPGHEHADGQHHEHHEGQHQHTHNRSGSTDGHAPLAAPRTHVAVRERRGPGGSRFAAIYPGLRSGDYTVWGLDGAPRQTVTIVGGEVTHIDWR